jgi:ribosomal protein L35AE/L33A
MVKSGKSLVCDGGKKRTNLRKREKINLTFEMWIFRNGQPVRDTDRIIIEVKNITDTQKSASYLKRNSTRT